MNNKKIVSIAISLCILIMIGIGFNSIFSNASKNERIADTYKFESNKSSKKLKTNIEEDINPKEEKVGIESKDEKNKKEDSNENKSIEENNIDEVSKPVIENKPITDINNKPEETIENTQPPKKDTVTIAISCNTAINNGVNNQAGFTHLPSNGTILSTRTVEIEDGDTVFDILQRIVRENGIHMEYTGSGSTIYIEGIHNLYEFDGGQNSGWMYSVNGWYPNYGCGVYNLKANDVIQWNYTCDLGNDLGANSR